MLVQYKKDLIKAFLVGLMLAVFGYYPAKALAGQIFPAWLVFVLLPVLAAAGIFAAALIGKFVPVFFQIAKFAGVGALNTLIDFSVLNFLMSVFQIYGGWRVGVFNAVSFSAAVANSYFWNKYWVFERKQSAVGKEFLQFLAVSASAIFINSGIVYILSTWVSPLFGVSPVLWVNLAKTFATIVSLAWNFIGYKFIVFSANGGSARGGK